MILLHLSFDPPWHLSMTESLPPCPRGSESMCEECEQLQKKIDRFRTFLNQFDPLTTKNMDQAVEALELQKAALHPDLGAKRT